MATPEFRRKVQPRPTNRLFAPAIRRRRAALGLGVSLPEVDNAIDRISVLAERANSLGTTLPVEALREVGAAADAHEVAGTRLSHPARNGQLLNELLSQLEAILIFDKLHLRTVAVLVHAALSAYTISASVLKGLIAMLAPPCEDARSAAALACGPLDRLASQGRRFRPSASLASRKGAPRPQWFREAFDYMVRVSKERDYGLKLGARPAAEQLPDLLRVRMVEAARAYWKLRSGVPEIGDGLSLAECELLGRQVVRDLNDADPHIARMATLAALVYSTECSLYVLRHILISAAAESSAWVSAGLSQFRIDMAALRTRPEDCGNPGLYLRTTTVAGSSLPRELGEQLKLVAERRGPAKSIGELLEIDDSTAVQLQEYLRERAPSSRSMTIERLARTRSRIVLALCHDESIAALLGVDLTIITSAVIHYVHATATDLNRATVAGCRAFGFSGDLAAPLTEDFSLNPHPSDATIAQFLTERADGVLDAIGSLPPIARAETLLARFDRAAGHLGAIARFSKGGRPSRRALLGMRALALCDGWAIDGDKSTSPYFPNTPTLEKCDTNFSASDTLVFQFELSYFSAPA